MRNSVGIYNWFQIEEEFKSYSNYHNLIVNSEMKLLYLEEIHVTETLKRVNKSKICQLQQINWHVMRVLTIRVTHL